MKNNNTDLFVESLHKLKNKIAKTVVTLRLEKDTHVPDLMTRIRILPSVAVVGQKEKVDRFMDGDARLAISVKFLPRSSQVYVSIKELCTMIKRLPGVLSITVETYDKRKVTLRGQKIIF
jgi:hypothetical protein